MSEKERIQEDCKALQARRSKLYAAIAQSDSAEVKRELRERKEELDRELELLREGK